MANFFTNEKKLIKETSVGIIRIGNDNGKKKRKKERSRQRARVCTGIGIDCFESYKRRYIYSCFPVPYLEMLSRCKCNLVFERFMRMTGIILHHSRNITCEISITALLIAHR